ncbi:MAG: hypothetical protein M1829_001995 [Trizodia sp. TS-e1964]|nr:MAG: hypothetical protein M1829_001995 [Trizodia sp. TS-e1964]
MSQFLPPSNISHYELAPNIPEQVKARLDSTIEAVGRYEKFLAQIRGIDPEFADSVSRSLVHIISFHLVVFKETRLDLSSRKLAEKFRKRLEESLILIKQIEASIQQNWGASLLYKTGDKITVFSASALMLKLLAKESLKEHLHTNRRRCMDLIAEKILDTVNYGIAKKSGTPRMLALCLGSSKSPHIHVGSTVDIWPKGTYLEHLAREARLQAMAGGRSGVTNLVKRFNQKLQGSGSPRENFRAAGLEGQPAVSLKSHLAQAFQGNSLEPRDRCLRCRGTFGFQWAFLEDDTSLKTVDFEGFVEKGTFDEKTAGKCAEYMLWLKCLCKIE